MRDIYLQASSVVVWLGKGSRSTDIGSFDTSVLAESCQYLYLNEGCKGFAAEGDTWANAKIIAQEKFFDKIFGSHRVILRAEGCGVDVISKSLLRCYIDLSPF